MSFNSIELAAGGFDFDSQYALTLTGGITLDAGVADTTISANLILGGAVAIDVSNPDANTEATLTISGIISGSNSLTKTGSGNLVLTGSNTGSNDYTGLTRVCGGTLELGLNAQPPVLTGQGGADIQEGTVVFDYTNSSNDPASNISSMLVASYGDGTNPFASGQIHDSMAAATGTAPRWSDDTTSDQFTIVCTLVGDANLDGHVKLDDLNTLLNNYGKTNATWTDGDFSYDGHVNLADLTKLLNNYGRTLNSGDLLLDRNSPPFDVELTDSGSDTLDVIGTVRLDNATLQVTSSRTNNDYGALRVLIRNEGGDPVIGTFNGLPEGAEVDVAGGHYFITYKYNAETGQFGTGNDVALCSSSYCVLASLLTAQSVTDYETHDLDATRVLSAFVLGVSLVRPIVVGPRPNLGQRESGVWLPERRHL